MADKKLEMLKALLEKELSPSEVTSESGRETAAKLQELFSGFRKSYEFREGTLATWKPGMRNKKKPAYNEPVIVVERKQTPEYDMSRDAGTAYFKEPLDLVAGFIDDDGDFVIFHFDSRRFQPFEL